MLSKERRTQLIKYANDYANIAVEEGSKSAMQKFWRDYTKKELFNVIEEVVILNLTKAYILCKAGKLSREECSTEQNKLLNILN